MTYNQRKHNLFKLWDKSINNNQFHFEIYDIEENFFNIYKSTIAILGIRYNDKFLDISILFEFLLKNSYIFFNILRKTPKLHSKVYNNSEESVDILCYLSLNLFIVEKLSILLKSLNISDEEIQECLDLNKINFMEVDTNSYGDYRNSILGVFNKIIEMYSKQSE
jgi:hypothetical protein